MKRFGWMWGFLLGLSLVGGLAAPGAEESPTDESLVQLRDVTVEPRDDGLAVRIKTSGAVKYETALIDTPTRLVIDLESTGYGWRKTPLTVGMDPLRQVRGSQFKKGVARVVLELNRKVGYWIEEGPEGLTVMLEPSSTPSTHAKAEDKPVQVAKEEASPQAETPLPPAQAEVPKAPEPPAVVKAQPQGGETAKERDVPKSEAAKPVAPAPKAKAPRPPIVSIPVVPPLASAPQPLAGGPQPAAGGPPAPIRLAQAPQTQPVANGSRLISLDFKDADIGNLLRILAAESGRNIVAGEDVKGRVSISLQNVPWELALQTILEAKGLEKVEKDNVIRIVSTEQLTKEREAKAKAEEAKLKAEAEVRTKMAEAQLKEADVRQRKLASEAAIAEAEARGPLKEEIIRLSYADPEDVAKTLQGILGIPEGGAPAAGIPLQQPGVTPSIGLGGAPPIAEPPFAQLYGPQPGAAPPPAPVSASAEVLAKGITIRAHKPTNTIFIRHYQADLERIKKLIRETLDVPLPQVKIEARMEILDRPSLFEIGIEWGGAGMRPVEGNVLVGHGVGAGVPLTGVPAFGGTPPKGSLGNLNLNFLSLLPIHPATGLPTGGNLVNLPFTGGAQSRAAAGGISFGIIGNKFNLNLVLQALERLEKARSLARPEIVTVENKAAQVSLGEEIPYATVSSAGTQIQFKEAVLKLQVTPTVIREGDVTKIKMKVIIENNERGVVLAGVPAIRKRRAETEVIVKEGEILVIGGVGQRTSTETITKVPYLGDIPVLGWFFRKQIVETDPDREMVVFITPSIIKGGSPVPSAQPRADKPKGL
ncbi:MAG: AMIN domain-containing protein [Candidatus Rokubacteria bacterium]|nr:AMIN domain-containing protein [Candidatus Rokubacteria bacterium]